MLPNVTPRVKICCISSLAEARTAIRHGASALGLVSAMPSGPGPISEELIREIARRVPPPIATFLLTSSQDIDEIIDQQRYCRTNTLQLVDRLTSGSYQDLRRALPGIALVQVIHVTGEASVEEALALALHVDALLSVASPPVNSDQPLDIVAQFLLRVPVYRHRVAGEGRGQHKVDAI